MKKGGLRVALFSNSIFGHVLTIPREVMKLEKFAQRRDDQALLSKHLGVQVRGRTSASLIMTEFAKCVGGGVSH